MKEKVEGLRYRVSDYFKALRAKELAQQKVAEHALRADRLREEMFRLLQSSGHFRVTVNRGPKGELLISQVTAKRSVEIEAVAKA